MELTRRLYDLERTEDGNVQQVVTDFIEYWKEKVAGINEVVGNAVREQLEAKDLANADEVGVAVEEAPTVHGEGPNTNAATRASAFPQDAQRWVYIFMGRMLHALRTQEKWQIIPFLKGRGGSGKSTVAMVVKHFFEAADVGILSNNSEKKFGLQALLDKFIWLCLELKKNVALDQAEFQSMVSGEDVMVAQKNLVARQVTWSAPGLLCGNEAPQWVDAQGSIARRMAIITFGYSLQERDLKPDLLEQILERELPTLIVKCNHAYRSICESRRDEDIWKVLPPYFKHERLRFQKDTDAVYAAVFDAQKFERWEATPNNPEPYDSYYVAFSSIEEHYRQKWRELMGNSYADPFQSEKYASAFQAAGIDGPFFGKRWCPVVRAEVTNQWCTGLRERVRQA